MQGKYIISVFCVIFLLIAPAAASTARVAAGSPVFIGESDVDISASLNGCHTIAWWKNGTPQSGSPPAKNVTVYEINSVSETIYHYNISPEIFTGFTGTWYCEDKAPHFPVFDLREPRIAIQVWDLDHDQDVSGKTVPRTTNVTYRIDTNLYPALNYLNRPNLNPSDGFFTVKLTDSLGRNVPNIFTGSYGGKNTLILPFENSPYVSYSPYFWKNGKTWDHTARNIQGDMIYPPGTYTFTLTQNLNHMQDSYGPVKDGKTISSATITFPAPEALAVPTAASTLPSVTISSPATTVHPPATAQATASPVPRKTTYSPLTGWIALAGLSIAGIFILRPRA